MLDNDNRNCNCMSNNMMSSYNFMPNTNTMINNLSTMNTSTDNMTTCDCDHFNQTREEMLEKIKCLNFAITELGLYLDTHNDDEKALCLHRKYCKEYRELTDKYQKVYGPLTIHFPCNKWRWIEEPWPWEGGIV